MILSAASSIYGVVALNRRRWYARASSRQRRLAHPVISVGNLSVGGSGKTPIVEYVVRLLCEFGERPAILSRGYARRIKSDGVTVVSTTARVIGDLDHSGDEPLMLARALPGVPVLVGADRYLSGRFAEDRFESTVLVLDDGFQHLTLARDVDLLLVDEDDLGDRVLPAGRLREPLSAAAAAHAVLVTAIDDARAVAMGPALGVTTVFRVQRSLTAVAMVSSGTAIQPSTVGPVFAVAGIARPQRLFETLASGGWRLGGTLTFRDHHRFVQSDVSRIAQAARDAQTHVVVTTTKDAVRLERLDCSSIALALASIAVTVEPVPGFRAWLAGRLADARARSKQRGALGRDGHQAP